MVEMDEDAKLIRAPRLSAEHCFDRQIRESLPNQRVGNSGESHYLRPMLPNSSR